MIRLWRSAFQLHLPPNRFPVTWLRRRKVSFTTCNLKCVTKLCCCCELANDCKSKSCSSCFRVLSKCIDWGEKKSCVNKFKGEVKEELCGRDPERTIHIPSLMQSCKAQHKRTGWASSALKWHFPVSNSTLLTFPTTRPPRRVNRWNRFARKPPVSADLQNSVNVNT